MPSFRRSDLQVWKFGGASLADAPAIDRAAGLIAAHSGPLVVVASALAGVTDLLLEGATASAAGDRRAGARAAAAFLLRHRQVARALVPAGPARRALLSTIDAAAREYRDLCGAVSILGHLAPRASDLLAARGERVSAAILAAAISRQDLGGSSYQKRKRSRNHLRGEYVDATRFIVTIDEALIRNRNLEIPTGYSHTGDGRLVISDRLVKAQIDLADDAQ